jgi:ADP-L-glycero-D-manno-heptose 6-epimerase
MQSMQVNFLGLNKVNILVTGYKGFIGQNLVPHLELIGHNVTGFEWGDVYPDIKQYDQVIHLGAISSTTELNVEKVIAQNYRFSCNLLDLCISYKIPFQYSSSASVYGLNQQFKETSPVDPRTPYAWSKYMFELYAEGKEVQGFRYFNVYGPHEGHKGSQASPYHQFTEQALNKRVINVFENSENFLRDFVPVKTVIDAHVRFMELKVSGIWNVGTGKAKSFLDVAGEVAEKYNASIEYIPFPEHLKHSYQRYTCADMTDFNKVYSGV